MDMYEKRVRLRELMAAPECVPVLGAYDLLSAKLIEATGFPVVYTGSFITGASQFFLADVGLVQLKDLLPLAYEIAKEVDLPLICDVDNGWFHSGNIWRTVHEFEAAGASGIQVEDGIGITLNGGKFTPRDVSGKEVPVFLYNGTTYAPVRAVCEAAGMEVSYNSATDTVVLTTMEQAASQKADSGSYIGESRAKEIALNDAGVKESNAVFLKVRLDWDDGRAEYEVEFYSGNVEYDYDIDAITGAIRSSDRDLEDFTVPSAVSSGTSGTLITADKAKSIALGRAPSGTTVVKCQLDRDDGRTVYEVEMRNGRMEYDCDIDAATGTILTWESDYD